MSASADLLRQVEAAGGRLIPRGGGRLRVEAPKPLPDELMAELRAHKRELLKLVRLAAAPRPVIADPHAVARWLTENPPERADPDHCAACGAPLGGAGLPLAVRARAEKPRDARGNVWVCDRAGRCVEAYYRQRVAEAERALDLLVKDDPVAH